MIQYVSDEKKIVTCKDLDCKNNFGNSTCSQFEEFAICVCDDGYVLSRMKVCMKSLQSVENLNKRLI